MPLNSVMILVERDANGEVSFRDVNGKVYLLNSSDDYVRATQTILDDPTLPEVEQVSSKQVKVEEVLKGTAEALIPRPFQPLAGFGFQKLQVGMKKIGTPRRVKIKPGVARRGRR